MFDFISRVLDGLAKIMLDFAARLAAVRGAYLNLAIIIGALLVSCVVIAAVIIIRKSGR